LETEDASGVPHSIAWHPTTFCAGPCAAAGWRFLPVLYSITVTDAPKPRRKFPWVRLGLFLSALLGVAVFLADACLNGGRASNGRNASTSLKTLGSAEMDFRENDRDRNQIHDYWVGDVSQLWYLEADGGPIKLIERSVANADGAPWKPLAEGQAKAGYLYRAIKSDPTGAPYDSGHGRNPSKFGFCAFPSDYHDAAWYRRSTDVSIYTFILNEENVIWRKDLQGAPALKWPKDPYAEGWTKLD
jgi:hypothetical protein